LTRGPSAPTATGIGSRRVGAVVPNCDNAAYAPERPVPATVHGRVQLTKREVFEACQALADADPVLVGAGGVDEARALGDLFELLEDRLTGSRPAVGALEDGRGD
jgi:hypothetical protein